MIGNMALERYSTRMESRVENAKFESKHHAPFKVNIWGHMGEWKTNWKLVFRV